MFHPYFDVRRLLPSLDYFIPMAFVPPRCPNLDCQSHSGLAKFRYRRRGFFSNSITYRPIRRYQCLLCRRTFSSRTFHPTYRQQRPEINRPLVQLITSTVSQRGSAKILKISRHTVDRRLVWLASLARKAHALALEHDPAMKSSEYLFDEMEAFEHTKCKPLSIPIAVTRRMEKIVGIGVASMPAKGRLAIISMTKYGPRVDERPLVRHQVLSQLAKVSSGITSQVLIKTDGAKSYKNEISRLVPWAKHQAFLSRAGAVAGEGVYLDRAFDPMFYLNHTCARIRSSLKRMVRKTWNTTKKWQRLEDQLMVFVAVWNKYPLNI